MQLALAVALAVGAPPSIEQLGWLVGTWSFTDKTTPAAGFTGEERGTRRCSFAIDRKYIRCESVGTSGERTRTYVFYFSHDPIDKRFEMVALHGNWPRTILHKIDVSADGKQLELLSDPYFDNGQFKRLWGIVRYDGRDRYVWETGNFVEGSDAKGPARFRDEARRVSR